MTGEGASRKRRVSGVLVVVAGLLLASALVRLSGSIGPALAEAAAASQSSDGRNPNDTTPVIRALEAVAARDRELDQKAAAIEERMAQLLDAEARLNDRIAELGAAEAALNETIQIARSANQQDLTQLTDVYQNMKPRDAAALFAAMDPVFAAGFLGRMRPDAAAAILSGLDPQVAYGISVVLAGRNANAPTQ